MCLCVGVGWGVCMCACARARVCINYEYLFGKRLCVQWTGTGNNNYVILSDYTRERNIYPRNG